MPLNVKLAAYGVFVIVVVGCKVVAERLSSGTNTHKKRV